ncbi:MAG: tail fiber domain-containing protein [Bryobacteraceae bacterium]
MLHYAKLATGVASAALCLVPCFAQRSTPDVDKVANWPAPLYWQRPAPSGQPDSSGRIAPGRETAQATETAQVGEAAVFVAITPCRLVDTRNNGTFPYPSTFGGPSMAGGATRVFPVPSGVCSLPAMAVAYSFNIAVVPAGTTMRWLTAWPDGDTMPTLATLNDKAGLVTSNAAIVAAGNAGAIDIYVEDATDVIVDVNGYYALPANLPFGGTAAAPALTFGNTTTGLYSAGTGELGIAAQGANVATVSSTGLSVPGNLDFGGMITYGGSALIQVQSSPSSNLAIGLNATPTTGEYNTMIGWDVASRLNQGTQDVAVGAGALGNTSMGSGYAVELTTAIGAYSLQNLSGSQNVMGNTALGASAGSSVTTGSYNTLVGTGAGGIETTGSYNTFVGTGAAGNQSTGTNATGSYNTFLGYQAGPVVTSGGYNTFVGSEAGGNETAGSFNTFVGTGAADGPTAGTKATGSFNTFLGNSAGYSVASGGYNTFLGYDAGYNVTTGSHGILIGNQGNAADANLIRIGTSAEHYSTYIAGIYGVTPSGAGEVVINSSGQLGSVTSSRRFKTDIADMGDTTETLMSLRPVQFRYIAHGPGAPLYYGLVAEEVAEIAPELVGRNANGEIETVFYDKVNAMLLNQVQTQQRQIESQKEQSESERAQAQSQIKQLTELVGRLESRLAELESRASGR